MWLVSRDSQPPELFGMHDALPLKDFCLSLVTDNKVKGGWEAITFENMTFFVALTTKPSSNGQLGQCLVRNTELLYLDYCNMLCMSNCTLY